MTRSLLLISVLISAWLFASQSFQWSNTRASSNIRRARRKIRDVIVTAPSTMQSSTRLQATIRMDEDEEGEETAAAPLSTLAPDVSAVKEGLKYVADLNGSDVRVGIIMARWNADIIEGLYKGVNESLTAAGVKQGNIFTTYVPGAFELPVTAKFLAMSKRVDVIICLGCLIKGDTMHFEYIAGATANGIMQVSLESLVPCLFGVLTVLDKQQAIDRSFGPKNEGLHWGKSAVEMALNRMSALGIGKPSTKGVEGNAFVAFKNGTLPTAPETEKDEKQKKRVFF